MQCPTCQTIKQSSPTPEGDEICSRCGDREMLDELPDNLLDSKASYLLSLIKDHKYYDHLKIYDLGYESNAFTIFKGLTEKQYRYILALLFNKKFFKLKQMLDSVGIKKLT